MSNRQHEYMIQVVLQADMTAFIKQKYWREPFQCY